MTTPATLKVLISLPGLYIFEVEEVEETWVMKWKKLIHSLSNSSFQTLFCDFDKQSPL